MILLGGFMYKQMHVHIDQPWLLSGEALYIYMI